MEQSEEGYKNFTVIQCKIKTIEWLYLANRGHRRARFELDNFEFTMEQSEEGYKNFTVIQCKIKSIEWLYLAAKGHRRAIIDLNGSKKFTWLVP